MGPFILAWMVGEGIIIYRSVKTNKCPPGPGQLLVTSGMYVMLAMLAEVNSARYLATALAWGFNAAAFMRLYDPVGGKTSGQWPPDKMPDNMVFPTGVPQGGGINVNNDALRIPGQ